MAQAQISPAGITLGLSQKQQFSVAGQTQLTWSVVPPNTGTITSTGLYTAPTSYTTNYVYIYARAGSSYYDTLVHLSPIHVSFPTGSSGPAVSISVSPSSIYLYGGQTHQFTATVGGTSNQQVSWSLAQGLGSIVNGLYSAPANVKADSLVTILATSVVDPTKTASATIQLGPGISTTLANTPAPNLISVSLSPRRSSLRAGQSKQFTATVSGTSNTAVNWSLTPNVGTLSNGIYTAPARIPTAQTVTLYAASAANTNQVTSVNINLIASESATASLAPSTATTSVTPATATVGAGGAVQFSVQNLPAGTRVAWSHSPGVGRITYWGLYRAPSSITTQQSITITATNVSTGQAIGTASVLLLTPQGPTPTSSGGSSNTQTQTIVLPVEVFGVSSASVPVSFSISPGANLSGQLQLWLQIHGLEYQSQASVQINSGAWIPINDTTVTYLGNGGTYGGIGGGFSTLKMTLNLPAGSVNQGTNTLTFRFNQSNGISSGFRVLNFNILAADGTQLIPQSTFTQDDPSTWTPPLNDAADIQAGQNLWRTAQLSAPGFGPIQAKCGSCHSQDGRDLKYFNYSNSSIETRAMFHGLNAQQGEQIASYIRSLDVTTSVYARPWNPPYQPGPGLDSRPVSDWAASAAWTRSWTRIPTCFPILCREAAQRIGPPRLT